MRNVMLWLGALCLLSVLWSPSVFAGAVGVYVEGSGGSGEMEWENDVYSWDVRSGGGAVGFVYDTAPTNESRFNYRLNVGAAARNWEDDAGVSLKSGGVYFENVFGFVLKRKESMRWWVGPLVRLGLYSGETEATYRGTMSSKVEVDFAEFGVGVVTGFNAKLKNNVILAPSAGLRVCAFSGEGTTTYRGSGLSSSIQDDFYGNTTELFLNLALLF